MLDTVHLPDAAHGNAISALRQEMKRLDLDAFILPRFDAHQGEYVAPHDERLAHVTGFSGSAGMAIVTAETVAIFVDGRYVVQLLRECPGPVFDRRHIFDEPPETWLVGRAEPGWRIGCDAMHLPPAWYDRFAGVCVERGAELVALDRNPVDTVWADQPAPPKGRIEPFPLQFAGVAAADKIAGLFAHMDRQGAALAIDTQPDNIAWLLNVRGADVAFNPVPQSFLIAATDPDRVVWFVDPDKFDEGLADGLPDLVSVAPKNAFLDHVAEAVAPGTIALVDPDFSPAAARLAVEKAGGIARAERSFLTRTKAPKNATELEGMRACQLSDGVAWTEFSAWLGAEVHARAAIGEPLTERQAEETILDFRRAQPGFLDNSFNPISASGANAAMCHYATSETSNAPILPDQPYLLDSGGQYETGTTDATRSFAFSANRPEDYDRAYTAVFKAFVAIATLRFPAGTQGHHIDAICRRPLWDLGLDYDHGTGHGVGHRLSVHEHPQRIAKPYNPVDLLPGMVLSIEPGHYVADLYGIRIENLFEVVEEVDGFMAFRTLTYAPIQTGMLIADQLTDAETGWLDAYHASVLDKLGPRLSERAHEWLSAVCDGQTLSL